MGLRSHWIALGCVAWLTGCGDGESSIEIVLDLPAASSASYPFGDAGVDTLRLAIARDGDDADLLAATEEVDESISLAGIPFGRDLVLHLVGEQGGADVAYGRSCAFDYEDDQSGPASIHIYFSRVVRWGQGPTALVAGRLGGHAFERANGSVVIAGGEQGAELELFNPRSGVVALIEEAPATAARRGSVLSPVDDDRALIVGGVDAAGAPVSNVELLPNLRDSLAGGLSIVDHAAAALVGGEALVAGGAAWTGSDFVASTDAWLLGIGDGGVVAPPAPTGSLAFARSRHTLTRLSDEVGAAVLAVGGLDAASQAVASAEVYRPLAGVFETVGGTLARWDHSAVRLPGGAVLIIGGFQPSIVDGTPEPARELVLFDPIGGTFGVAGELPTTAPLTDFTLTRLPDGRVLLTGGRDGAGNLSAATFVVRFDVINGLVDVAATEPMQFARANHAATALCDGTILISGGSTEAGVSTERYNPTPTGRR